MHNQDLKKGVGFVLLAWFFSAGIYLLAKLLADQTSVSVMLFSRALVATLVILPWMVGHGKKSFRIASWGWTVGYSICITFLLAFTFLAVKTLSLVNTTLLINSAPFFVPFFGYLLFKKPIVHRLWPAIILGFIGVGIVLQPNKDLIHLGSAFALGAGICSALGSICLRELKGKVDSYAVAFYSCFLGVLLTAPFAIYNWQIVSSSAFVPLAVMGILAALAQWTWSRAFHYAEASYLAPFGYSGVIFSGIFDWIFFDMIPGWFVLLGTVFIILSGIWILRTKPATAQEK